MTTFIVGHRGVGKSTFLRRLKVYFERVKAECICFDLDEEIERFEQLSVSEIFQKKGEAYFRTLEQKMAEDLCKKDGNDRRPLFLAVGAGFQGPFPDETQVLWLRRETDKDGRIFFDRPLLDASKKPLDDYLSHFVDREYFYSQVSDEQLMMPEGFEREAPWEENFLGLGKKPIGGFLTLFEQDLKKFSGGETFLARRMHWGVDRFELRDDLLDDVLIRYVLGLIPKDRLIMSFRSRSTSILHSIIDDGCYIDWPLEKGSCPFSGPTVLSLHTRESSLQDTLLRFEESAPQESHLKLAVEINTLQELYEGHLWWRENAGQRSFLPVSHDGRWRWYRSLFGRQMKVGFFREGEGSCLDQPYLSEWIRAYRNFIHFGAVLGDPVHHSQSPAEQNHFFASHQMPFVAINIEDRGDFQFHLEILRKMGLRAAAVTAPYKQRAFEACNEVQKQAASVKSVNTLLYKEDDQQWIGGNTDLDGLQTVKDLYPELGDGEGCIIWGGGGTQGAMEKLLPKATKYSARQATPVMGQKELDHPKVVVWAVGRSRQEHCGWPNPSWRPQFVFDLNYSMDSPGREYAIECGAEYISGRTLFQSQARAQQRFWIEHKL